MAKRARMPFPRPLGDIARDELTTLGLSDRLREADIWRLWPEVVGETVVARAMPVRIIRGTLTVAVSSGPWKQELNFLKAMMIEKINGRIGSQVVREIVLTSGSVKTLSEVAPEEKMPRKKKLTARQLAQIDEQSAAISDPETRAAFAELMRAHHETA